MTFLATRTALRPLRLRDRRQSGSRRTRRHQHQAADRDGLHADGRSRGGLGLISSARLDSATNALGQFNELYVIAAAVIGGTSLAGGIGTIYGAMLGALVMQSLQSGMTLLNFESADQGHGRRLVLVFAVLSTRSIAGGVK